MFIGSQSCSTAYWGLLGSGSICKFTNTQFIDWGRDLLNVNGMVLLVCDKVVPMDLLLSDSSLSELYAEDKLSREASFNLLRSLITAVESLWPDAIQQSQLPASACLRGPKFFYNM